MLKISVKSRKSRLKETSTYSTTARRRCENERSYTEATAEDTRSYGTPLVTKIQDTQRHVQTTNVTFKQLNVTSRDFTYRDFSTSRPEISQHHVERFLNVTSRTKKKHKNNRTVDVTFKTLKKVIAVQLSRAQ